MSCSADAETDTLGFLHLVRIGRYFAATLHAAENWGSRDNHDTLSLRLGSISSVLHSELDLQVLFRGSTAGSRSVL